MCRLFGLHAGDSTVPATFWLLQAPDSLAEQSRRNPDGAGIGVFTADGGIVVDKQPMAAWQDRAFATGAHDLRGSTFVAHVRYASVGAHSVVNTHPFQQDGRLFAHNGVLHDLPRLDARLTELGAADLVAGETDSERMFALFTACARRSGGDVGAAIGEAFTWICEHVGVYSLNCVITTATDLWALRYPDTHPLYVLPRPAGTGGVGLGGERAGLHVRSHRISAHSEPLASRASVIVATEPMDGEAGWQLLPAGELLHVDRSLAVHRSRPLPERPRHLLQLADLDERAAASQHPQADGAGRG